MKRCPKCNQTYTDADLNFCLQDGELLMQTVEAPSGRSFDDTPPTVMMNDARVTNPTNWQPSTTPATWQSPQPNYQQPLQFSQYPMVATPNQTLAVVSLGLGVGSLTIGWCCSLGLILSPAALITGVIAMSQIKKDPKTYGGRGLAVGGLVTGSIFLAVYLLLIILYGAAIFLGGIGH